MRTLTYPLFVLLIAFSHPTLATSFYDDKARGWFWYEETEVELEVEEIESVPVLAPEPIPITAPILSPSEQLKAQGVALENAMATAILTPSPENYTVSLIN